jgi:hypothetical protein
VRDWLREAGWTVEQAGLDEWWFHWDADAVGLTASVAFPGLEALVSVVAQPGMWIAGDGTAAPACRSCGTPVEDPWDMLRAWDGPDAEPASTCGACGWAALLGEWDLSGSVANGAVAVVLDIRDTAPDLDMDTLVDDLLRVLRDGPGGRQAWVHLHI